MHQLPSISVVTAVYNGAAYLDDLIQSVLAQHYPNVEHLIIDDGSTDRGATVEVLRKYPHLKWWSQSNQGQYATQNNLLDHAQGEIICVIAADDIIEPGTFEEIARQWAMYPGCEVIYGKTTHMDEKKTPLMTSEPAGKFPRVLIKSFLFAQHCSMYVSRSFIQKYNIRFDPRLKYAGDWDWIIQLFDKASLIVYVPKTFACVRLHLNQMSRTGTKNKTIEHRLVMRRYHSSFLLYKVIRIMLTIRLLFLVSRGIILNDGFLAFLERITLFARKRYLSP